MNSLSIVGACLRHSDTLYYLLQKKQEEHQKAAGTSVQSTQKLWNYSSVAELREALADIERHMSAHAQTSGKAVEELLSDDEAYGTKHSLMSVKVYTYSLCNMASEFFRADDTTPAKVNAQITEIIGVVKCVKERLDKCGVRSDVVDKGTTCFHKTVSELSCLFRDDEKLPTDESLCKNVQVFRRFLKLAEEVRQSDDGSIRQFDDDDVSGIDNNGAGPRKNEELFALIPAAAKVLMDDLGKRKRTQDERVEHLRQLKTLWSDCQINKRDISYEYDEFDEKIWLGQGATGVVYAGFLNDGGAKRLPVAVKTKPMKKPQIPDVLREVFLHLMVQHHRIITLFGMWYPPLRAHQALIVVERMTRTLADAMENDDHGIDHVVILRDTASAIAHLHDHGIVHRDVKPANIMLNQGGTQAKLADFGTSRRRFNSTTTTVATQQAGTPFYMAPEVRENQRCKTTPQMDCWAFGLLMCEVMNAAGRNAFVGAHHGDLHGAAKAWADGIRDKRVKVAATACLQREAKHRPVMKEVYLHLAGALEISEGMVVQQAVMTGEAENEEAGKTVSKELGSGSAGGGGVSDERSVHTSGESQEVEGRNWENFVKVETRLYSESVEIWVANETEAAVEMCRAHADGRLRSALRVKGSAGGRLTKTAEEKGTFFVLRDARTHALRAAFASKGIAISVTVGQNYVHFRGNEPNLANKGDAPWPLRSAASTEPVALTVENKWHISDFRVSRVDGSGHEAPLIEKVARPSNWTGHAPGGSVLVFRCNIPEDSTWDRSFVCAVCVPTASPGFTVILDKLSYNLK